ncbi:MAG: hypothetical protein J6O73_17540 [Lachnospiraceae bacterium]|nr:hypothetical protein [Lachnospiraceae bacterium]
MAGIHGINSGIDYSVFFGGSSTSSADGVDLTSYRSIKNGSYRRLLKNYYGNQKEEARSAVGDSGATLTKIRSAADSLQKKSDALSSEKLWATTENVEEGSGKVTETLTNPEALVKAVKEFADAYNKTIDAAAGSETKAVLRSGGWMDNMSRKNGRLLNEVGITIGSDGKLSVDEEELKKANVTTLKNLFKEVDSYAAKVSAKAAAISNSAARTESMYDSGGKWNNPMNAITGAHFDSVIGGGRDKETSAGKARSETENTIKSLKEKREKLQQEMKKAVGYDATWDYETQIKKLDKEIKEAENRLNYL